VRARGAALSDVFLAMAERSCVLIAAGDYCTQYGAACVAAESVLVKKLFENRAEAGFKPRKAR
jgi:hypothetical protein